MLRSLPVLVFVVGSISLGAHADSASAAPAFSLAAPEGKARVLLVRERFWNHAAKYRIVDESPKCLSAVKGKRHAAFDLPPGSHELYVLVPTTRTQAELLKLDVEAGRTYVIELASQALRKKNVEVHAVRPNTVGATNAADGWKRTKRDKPKLGKCDEWLSRKDHELPRKLEHAKQEWDAANKEYRESHTLRPEDGFSAEDLAAMFVED